MSESGATRVPGSSFSAVPISDSVGPSPDPLLGEQTVISNKAPIGDLSVQEIGKSLEGEQLGPLILKEFVGGGGMGAVFRALDTTLNREVAVKLLSHGQSQDEETLRRFKNEAQSAARLDHENIARVYHVGEDRGVHYIVFEFIEGINLRDLVERDGPLALADAISYTLQIAEALSHSSQRDVIHRDIKPSNVLITPDGKAKLVDMGLARLHQVEHSNRDLTASGVTLGTFDYISPEQARDPRSADVRSDLYSLGCSLYFMLTGKPPFPEGTVLQKLLQHQGDEPPDARELRPDLPAQVLGVVARLLAKNPQERYQLPAELSYELVEVSAQLGIATTTVPRVVVAPRASKTPSRLRSHLGWMLPLAALPVIVVTLHYIWSREAGQPIPSILKMAPASTVPDGEGPTVESDPLQRGRGGQAHKPQAGGGATPSATQAARANVTRTGGGPHSDSTTAVDNRSNNEPGTAAGSQEPRLTTALAEEGVLVVGDESLGPHVYSSLEAACSKAKSGDVIELRYTGRREERPITLANPRLTIRAKEGFKPIVVFRAAQVDPLKFARSMISISGGQLRLLDTHIEFEVDSAPAGDWTLLEVAGVELLQLQKCTLTIRNNSAARLPYASGANFFQVKLSPAVDSMNMGTTATEQKPPPVRIELKHCVVRGEATVLRTEELQPVEFAWENGLLVTSERFLAAGSGPLAPSMADHLEINLRHLTALLYEGLALLTTTQDQPYQLQTSFEVSDSILIGPESATLVEQRGSQRADEFRDRLAWNASRNFYEGFGAFWRISDPITPAGPRPLDFNWWCQRWGEENEYRPARNAITWAASPLSVRPFNVHKADNYVFATGVGPLSASDGLDAGFLRSALPELPAAPLAEETTPQDSPATR